jgi:glycerophosphoryl diester phosphodiesterase
MPANGFQCAAQAFQIPHEWEGQDLARPEMIALLHQMGIEVHYWTINDTDLIKKLLAAGADGIVTDFPELARDF